MSAVEPASFNPYPGLRPFGDAHADYFKGRDRHVTQIVRILKGERFVSIVGVSGSGKSSLVHAGVIPKLHEGQMLPVPERRWEIVTMTPAGAPWSRLAGALKAKNIHLPAAGRPATALIHAVEAVLRQAAGSSLQERKATPVESGAAFALLLVVDQFEEIFHSQRGTLPPDAEDFVRALLFAGAQKAVPIYIVITMRSDFTGDCARFRDLPEKIDRTQFLVPRMTPAEMTEAIREPARLEGGRRIQWELVQRLLSDTGDNPDRLPLLQHALSRLWEQSSQGLSQKETLQGNEGTAPEITLTDYAATGHIPRAGGSTTAVESTSATQGESATPIDVQAWATAEIPSAAPGESALDRHAESIYNPDIRGFTGEQIASLRERQQYTERLFRFLTQRESGLRDTRVKHILIDCARVVFAPVGAAADWRPRPDQVRELASIIDQYRAPGCWFLRPYTDDISALREDDLIDITHESLIAGWSRLQWWVDLEHRDARAYHWHLQAAENWVRGDGGLPSAEDLVRFERWRDNIRLNHAWAHRYGGRLDDINQHTTAGRLKIKDEKGRKRKGAIWKLTWGIFTVIAVLISAALWLQAKQKAAEDAQLKFVLVTVVEDLSNPWLEKAEASVLEAKSQTDILIQAFQAAGRNDPPGEIVIGVVQKTKDKASDAVRAIEHLPASIEKAATAIKEKELSALAGGIRQRLLSIETKLTPVLQPEDGVKAVNEAIDQRTASAQRIIDSVNPVERFDRKELSAALTRVTAEKAAIDSIIDLAAKAGFGDIRKELIDRKDTLEDDFKGLSEAVVDQEKEPLPKHVWTAQHSTELRHSGKVVCVRFAPPGADIVPLIATANDAGTAGWLTFWRADGTKLRTWPLQSSTADIEFSSKHDVFAAGSSGGTVRVFHFSRSGERILIGKYTAFDGHSDSITDLDYFSDSRKAVESAGDERIASCSADRTVRVFNARTMGTLYYTSPRLEDIPTSVAFHPEGKLLVSGCDDGWVGLHTVDPAGTPLRTLGKFDAPARRPEFSADGRLVIAASGDKTARIWAVDSGNELARLPHAASVTHATFRPFPPGTPAGVYDFVTCATNGEVQSGQITNATQPNQPMKSVVLEPRHRGAVLFAAWSRKGDLLATVGGGEVIVWTWTTERPHFPILRISGTEDPTRAVFSLDGRWLVTWGGNQIARVWDLHSLEKEQNPD